MKRWQIVFGITLIVLGLFSLIDVFFNINPWRYFGPLLLIGLGILLILRPRVAAYPGGCSKEGHLGSNPT